MQNQIGNFANIADLNKEGKALNAIWKATNSVRTTTQAKGFDTRLGKLLQQLRYEAEGGRISRQQLHTVGVTDIPKQRRSEALWFVDNEVECRDFISKSKKGFSSLSALKRAMKQATEGDTKSNVGQTTKGDSEAKVSEATPTKEITKGDMISLGTSKASVIQALKLWAMQNNTTLEELAESLLDACDDPVTKFQVELGNPKLSGMTSSEACPF